MLPWAPNFQWNKCVECNPVENVNIFFFFKCMFLYPILLKTHYSVKEKWEMHLFVLHVQNSDGGFGNPWNAAIKRTKRAGRKDGDHRNQRGLCVCVTELSLKTINKIHTAHQISYISGCIHLHCCFKAEKAQLACIPKRIIQETERKRSLWE